MTIQTVDLTDRALNIHWADGTSSSYPYLFLRDNDPQGFHPQTQERQFDLLSVPVDLRAAGVSLDADCIVIDWSSHADQPSRIAFDWLDKHRPGRRNLDAADVASELWDGTFRQRIPSITAAAFAGGGRPALDWLLQTKRHGLSLVTDIADDENAGVALGEAIGFMRQTNFGLTFRVETMPDPNNLAYTSHMLPLHTDLPNQEMPPGYQFLHCVRNGAEGGNSTFADSYHIAEKVRQKDQEAFRLLTEIAIPYRFRDRSHDIRVHRPMVSLDERGNVFDVRYSAHLMDCFDMESDVMVDYYRAYRLFMAETRNPSNLVEFKLNPGQMVVFDNRRTLHGRTAFNPATGHRLLKGYYIDRGEWDSRIRKMAE